MPRHPSTWSRVSGHAVDVVELQAVCSALFREQQATVEVPARGRSVLAIDGKTVRGTIPSGQTRGVHLLAAYLTERGVTLAQVAVECKQVEIGAAPALLKRLDLTGVVVTGDAMHAPRALSCQIAAAQGSYGWCVTESQPELLASVELLFEPPRLANGWSDHSTDCTIARQVDNGHGRLEERIITVSRMRREYGDWPQLDQVFRLERRVTTPTTRFTEVRYGITSLPPSVAPAHR